MLLIYPQTNPEQLSLTSLWRPLLNQGKGGGISEKINVDLIQKNIQITLFTNATRF